MEFLWSNQGYPVYWQVDLDAWAERRTPLGGILGLGGIVNVCLWAGNTLLGCISRNIAMLFQTRDWSVIALGAWDHEYRELCNDDT